MVWNGEKILDPDFTFFSSLMLYGIRFMYFMIFTLAYLRHTNKQDGAKEEDFLIIRCISEFVNEICTFDTSSCIIFSIFYLTLVR